MRRDWHSFTVTLIPTPAIPGYGLMTRKNALLEVMAFVCGFWMPKLVHRGLADSALVFCRMKPGPLLQDTMTLLPLRVIVNTGRCTTNWKLSAVAPPG